MGSKHTSMEETYEKGTSGSSAGFMYQIKLLVLFLLRGVLQPNKFKLATEMKQDNVGKFDDIIFSYIDEYSVKQSILLQAKHSTIESKKKITLRTLSSIKDNEFSLVKYFHSYLDKIKTNENVGKIQGLVIFTNLSVDRSVKENVIHLSPDSQVFRLSKIDTSGSFYTFTQTFMSEIGRSVISYHCNFLARNLLNDILSRRNIKLSWNQSNLKQIESALYCQMFELSTGEDKHRIMGLRQDFIRVGDDNKMNETCSTFRSALVEELKIKSKLFREQMRTTHKSNALYDLEDLNIFLQSIEMYAEGEIKLNIEADINISEESVKEFSELFVLAVDQPNVDDLDEVIKELLRQYPLFQGLSVDSAARHLLSLVNKWFDERTGIYLNETSSDNLLINIYLELMSLLYVWKNIYPNIEFEKVHLHKLRDVVMTSPECCIQVRSHCDSKLLITKLYQALQDKGSNYLYLDLKLVRDKLGEGLNVINFLQNTNSFSVIVVDCTASNESEFISLMKDTIMKVKIIFITSHSHTKIANIHEDVEIAFTQLTEHSQDLVLSKNIIHFQGRLCSYKNIFENTQNIDDEIFHEIMSEEAIVIGEIPHSLSDLPATYSSSSQEITLNRFIDLLSDSRYIFAVSGCGDSSDTEKHLLKLCGSNRNTVKDHLYSEIRPAGNIVIFNCIKDNPFWSRSEFHNICKRFPNKIIFWIDIKNTSAFLHQVYNPFFYIKRQLRYIRSVEVNPTEILNVLKNDNSVGFMITGVPTKHKFLKYLGCSDEELKKRTLHQTSITFEYSIESQFEIANDQFEKFKRPRRFTSVHWLEWRNGKFVWVKSHGPLDFIRKGKQNVEIYDENQFVLETKNTLVIISDDAGMGKSTTLTSMSRYIMDSQWIVRINFKETSVQNGLEILYDTSVTIDTIIHFICHIDYLNLKSSVAKSWLKYCLTTTTKENNKLLFILDGLDEVPSSIEYSARRLLEFLASDTTCTVYLATRHHYAPSLEDKYSILSTRFQQISLNEQCMFLVSFWFNHLTLKSETYNAEELHTIAEDLLKRMTNVLKDGCLRFIGIPLHLRLISEISVPHVVQNTIREFLKDNLDMTSVFKQFIRIKYDVYFNEKNVESSSSHVLLLSQIFHETHSKFAFQYLFPNYFNVTKVDVSADITKFAYDYVLIGILLCKWTVNEYSFIHRTFCEYYCASFLMSCLRSQFSNETFYQMAMNVLQNELFLADGRDPYKMLKFFMDSMLVVGLPLHEAIFNNDSKLFTKVMYATQQVQRVDALGRSALHYAAQYGNDEMVTVLTNKYWKSWDICTSDVLGRIPLHYATRYGRSKIVEALVTPYIDVNIHNNMLDKALDKYDGTPNNIFLDDERTQSVLFMMINTLDGRGHTCLYYAADSEAWTLCCFLISHGASCSSLTDTQESALLTGLINISLSRSYQEQSDILPSIILLMRRNPKVILNLDETYSIPRLLSYLYNGGYLWIIIFLLNQFDPEERSRVLNFIYNGKYFLDRLNASARLLTDADHLNILKYSFENKSFSVMNNPDNSNVYVARCLQYAAAWGHIETFKFIVNFAKNEYLANPNNMTAVPSSNWYVYFHDINFNTYIGLATVSNHINVVEYIWRELRDLTADMFGNTALMYAAERGTLQSVKYLCENGAEVNAYNQEGKTSLHIAVEVYRLDVIKYLVSKGGDVNIVDSNGNTVLDCALRDKLFDPSVNPLYDEELLCVQYLILNCKAQSFVDMVFHDTDEDYTEQIVKASYESVNKHLHGTTLLHKAVEMKNEIFVRHLLSLGANINAKDASGKTPLESMEEPYPRISRILLQNGARFNSLTKHHLSTSNYGTYNNSVIFSSNTLCSDINTYILNNERLFWIDPENSMIFLIKTLDNKGQTLLHRAALLNDIDALNMILKYDEKYYSKRNYYKHAKGYKSLNVSIQDDDGNSPLHIAAQCGHSDIVNLLLKNGAMYDSVNNKGETPELCCTCNSQNSIINSLNIISMLQLVSRLFVIVKQNDRVRYDSNDIFDGNKVKSTLIDPVFNYINVRDKYGRTPLHWAVFCGHNEMMQHLLRMGANIEAADNDLQTALHYAVKNGPSNYMICDLLIHGSAFNCRDRYGKMPSDLYEESSSHNYILKNIERLFNSVKNDAINESLLIMETLESSGNTAFTRAAVNTCDDRGSTLLHYAINHRSLQVVYFVLKNGGMYNKSNSLLYTPVKFTNDQKISDLLTFISNLFNNELVSFGCSLSRAEEHRQTMDCILNVRNKEGDTLLHCVTDAYLATWLVKYSTNLNVLDKEGRTPLMRAVMKKRMLIINVLCEGGADVHLCAYNGENVRDIANHTEDLNVINLIGRRWSNRVLQEA